MAEVKKPGEFIISAIPSGNISRRSAIRVRLQESCETLLPASISCWAKRNLSVFRGWSTRRIRSIIRNGCRTREVHCQNAFHPCNSATWSGLLPLRLMYAIVICFQTDETIWSFKHTFARLYRRFSQNPCAIQHADCHGSGRSAPPSGNPSTRGPHTLQTVRAAADALVNTD
jgi:hypothetical protein